MKQLDSLIRAKFPDSEEDKKPYQSHLTLARVKSARNVNIIKTIIKRHANSEFGKMLVDKFVLYSSDLSRGKPVYSVIKEFKLK